MSEPLREEQGEGEIGEQENRNDQSDHGDDIDVHGGLPQLLAGLDVEKRHGEEDYGEKQHDCILHSRSHFAQAASGRQGFLTGLIFD
jgi:hypothetical protein